MSAEIPEIFRALLEHPFTLPSFDENGKWPIGSGKVLRRSLRVLCKTAIP